MDNRMAIAAWTKQRQISTNKVEHVQTHTVNASGAIICLFRRIALIVHVKM